MLLQTEPHGRQPHPPPPRPARFRRPVRRRSTPGPESRHDPEYGWLGLATSGSPRRCQGLVVPPGRSSHNRHFRRRRPDFAEGLDCRRDPADCFVGRHRTRRIEAAPSARFDGRGFASSGWPSPPPRPPLSSFRGGPNGAAGGTNHQPQDIGAPKRPPPSPAIPFGACSRRKPGRGVGAPRPCASVKGGIHIDPALRCMIGRKGIG